MCLRADLGIASCIGTLLWDWPWDGQVHWETLGAVVLEWPVALESAVGMALGRPGALEGAVGMASLGSGPGVASCIGECCGNGLWMARCIGECCRNVLVRGDKPLEKRGGPK